MNKFILLLSTLIFSSLSFASEIERIVAYSSNGPVLKSIAHPEPKEGYKEVVLNILYWDEMMERNSPEKYKIELRFRKMWETDSCNRYSFGSSLNTLKVPGASYLDYYELDEVRGPSSTRMGCRDNRRLMRLVDVLTFQQFTLFRVSNVIVLHLPKDVEVDYRVWKADDHWSAKP